MTVAGTNTMTIFPSAEHSATVGTNKIPDLIMSLIAQQTVVVRKGPTSFIDSTITHFYCGRRALSLPGPIKGKVLSTLKKTRYLVSRRSLSGG